MRLYNVLKADLLFQWKQGFYIIYMILTLVYLVILGQMPELWLGYAVPLILYSDPSVLGMFFIGGIVLLEKEQGILDLLTITPLKTREFVISKLIALTAIALISGLAITVGSGVINVNYLLLSVGIVLTSVFYTSFGMVVSLKCQTVNGYFIKIVPWTLLMLLPFLGIIPLGMNPLLEVFPSYASLFLILSAYQGSSPAHEISLIVFLCLVDTLMVKWVVRKLDAKTF